MHNNYIIMIYMHVLDHVTRESYPVRGTGTSPRPGPVPCPVPTCSCIVWTGRLSGVARWKDRVSFRETYVFVDSSFLYRLSYPSAALHLQEDGTIELARQRMEHRVSPPQYVMTPMRMYIVWHYLFVGAVASVVQPSKKAPTINDVHCSNLHAGLYAPRCSVSMQGRVVLCGSTMHSPLYCSHRMHLEKGKEFQQNQV